LVRLGCARLQLTSERLLDNFEPGSAPELEPERVLEAPGVAHLRYRVT
jgi:hypothetical protein